MGESAAGAHNGDVSSKPSLSIVETQHPGLSGGCKHQTDAGSDKWGMLQLEGGGISMQMELNSILSLQVRAEIILPKNGRQLWPN